MSSSRVDIDSPTLVSSRFTQPGQANRFPKKEVWAYWIDDIPVAEYTYKLCKEIRAASPMLRFAKGSSSNLHEVENVDGGQYSRIYEDAYVYTPASEYISGRVGYGKFKLTGKGLSDDKEFMVESRKIRNGKFRSNTSTNARSFSSDVKKSVKDVLKYCTPWSAYELANASRVDFYDNTRQPIANAFSDLRRAVPEDMNIIINEVIALREKGVEFCTPQFQQFAKEVDEKRAAYNEAKMYKYKAYFVAIRGAFVDILTVDDVRSTAAVAPTNSRTYRVADLPEDIMERLATLQILDPGQYVHRVGKRESQTTFWIERHDQ